MRLSCLRHGPLGIALVCLALAGCVTDEGTAANDNRGFLYKVADKIDSALGLPPSLPSDISPAAGSSDGVQMASADGGQGQLAQSAVEYRKPALPELRGPKKVVAVSRFENRTSFDSGGQFSLGSGMADQLTDALVQSGHFVVLERQTLSDVIGEQDLAASGRASKSRSAETGKITAAQVLVKGTITEFTPNSSGTGQAVSFMGVSIGSDAGESHVALIIRLINTTTGVVISSKRVETKVPTGGFNFGLNLSTVGFRSNSFQNSPIGKAVQISIDQAVAYVAEELNDRPFEGRIIKTQGRDVYLSAGQRNNVSVGDRFVLFSVGEELKDPQTGEILGREEKQAGALKVTSVKARYSIGKLEPGAPMAKVGDTFRSE